MKSIILIFEYIQNNTNQVIAFAAIFALILTFISILITAISVSLQRKHNKQSVKPILNIILADYENRISVMLQNKGLGPLTIEHFYVLKDEKKIENNLIDCMPDLPDKLMWKHFIKDFNGKALTASEKISGLTLSGDVNDNNFCTYRDEVRKRLSLLTVKVDYKDIYGKNMPTCERQLKWFGRHF